MASFKSILKPEGSIASGIAVAAVVFGIFQLHNGSMVQAHASEPNFAPLDASHKKAGYESLVFVSTLTLLTRDSGVGILGFSTIIAMELAYKHSIMVDPSTGMLVPPNPTKYVPASVVNSGNTALNAGGEMAAVSVGF